MGSDRESANLLKCGLRYARVRGGKDATTEVRGHYSVGVRVQCQLLLPLGFPRERVHTQKARANGTGPGQL